MFEPSVPVEDEHVFNGDLLTHKTDLEFAMRRFPRILHILDHPRLRAEFAKYDRVANEARGKVRLYGFLAVTASTLALLALATRPVWPHALWNRWLAGAFEFGGMVAALIAIGGLWSGKWKHRWLTSRLMTERLRQWHFQLIVRRGHEVEASCKDEASIKTFQEERDRWLEHFLMEYRGHLDSQLESTIEDPLEKIAWLHEDCSKYAYDGTILKEVFVAYELLRFNHQYGFAVCKLESSTIMPIWKFLKWPAKAQRSVLSGATFMLFVTALILSALLICVNLFSEAEALELYLRTAAIAVAIIGAALSTIYEGLGVDAEIDRYREYREKISRLHDRFKHSTEGAQRLRCMEDMEYASVEEMQDFLRAHQKAKFVLA